MSVITLIHVDKREKESIIPELFEEWGLPVEYVMLPVGNYVVNGDYVVERKEVCDFLQSLKSGRLSTQLYQMSYNFPVSTLIVEGNVDKILPYTNMKKQTFLSALTGVFVRRAPDGKQGLINVLMVSEAEDTALVLKYMRDKIEKGEPRLPLMKRVNWSKNDQITYIIGSFPGVGEKRAKDLTNHFESIRKLANSSWEEITKVSGIGEKTAKKIENLFNAKVCNKE